MDFLCVAARSEILIHPGQDKLTLPGSLLLLLAMNFP